MFCFIFILHYIYFNCILHLAKVSIRKHRWRKETKRYLTMIITGIIIFKKLSRGTIISRLEAKKTIALILESSRRILEQMRDEGKWTKSGLLAPPSSPEWPLAPSPHLEPVLGQCRPQCEVIHATPKLFWAHLLFPKPFQQDINAVPITCFINKL